MDVPLNWNRSKRRIDRLLRDVYKHYQLETQGSLPLLPDQDLSRLIIELGENGMYEHFPPKVYINMQVQPGFEIQTSVEAGALVGRITETIEDFLGDDSNFPYIPSVDRRQLPGQEILYELMDSTVPVHLTLLRQLDDTYKLHDYNLAHSS